MDDDDAVGVADLPTVRFDVRRQFGILRQFRRREDRIFGSKRSW